MSATGALVPPMLAAQVYWTLGRCAELDALNAISAGDDLLAQIAVALEDAFQAGVKSGERVVAIGGGGGSVSVTGGTGGCGSRV